MKQTLDNKVPSFGRFLNPALVSIIIKLCYNVIFKIIQNSINIHTFEHDRESCLHSYSHIFGIFKAENNLYNIL